MPFCRECGFEVQAGWKFCPNCNAPQETSGTVQSANIKLSDTVIDGNVTITQNNADDIASAMVQALERLGFSEQSSPAELTAEQTTQVEQVLEVSEQLAGHGIEIDPWTEITLGNAALLAGRTHSAQQHYLRALESFRKNGDRYGEATSLSNLGIIAGKLRGDLAEAERLNRESLTIQREIGDREGEATSLNDLGNIALTRGDLAEGERLYRESLTIRESLAIDLESGDRYGEAQSLYNLGLVAKRRGDLAEAELLYRESLTIEREIGARSSHNLSGIAELASLRGDLAEAERLYRESLTIQREIGHREGEARLLIHLGDIISNDRRRMYTEAVRIQREIGIPIDQWFIDNGY